MVYLDLYADRPRWLVGVVGPTREGDVVREALAGVEIAFRTGAPVGAEGLVAGGALRDSDSLDGRGLAVPDPAREDIAGAGGIDQREGGGFGGVGGRVAGPASKDAARKVEGDGLKGNPIGGI